MLGSSTRDAKMFASRTGKKWVNSKLIDYCAECDQKFTMINRKHHCRQCGEVICSKCSPDRALIGDSTTPLRICRSCFVEHQKFSTASPLSASGLPGSVDKDDVSRHGTAGDFHGRYERIKNCYTSNKYHYGPAPSQYFILHIPREVMSASAALYSSHTSHSNFKQPSKSVPIIVLIHGGFWKFKYGIDNSTIDSLVPFFLSKGMAVCQIEYRRVGSSSSSRWRKRDGLSPHEHPRRNSSPATLSQSPTAHLHQFSPGQLLYSHVVPQLDDSWEARRQAGDDAFTECRPASTSGTNIDSRLHCEQQQPNDEGGFPQTNEDILQALRLLHHKCSLMNTTASGVDSFTHHYIAANGSRCISRLAKVDPSRMVLWGHSAGGYLALWACCRLQEKRLPHPPLLCVAVAPVCNLAEAHSKSVGGTAVRHFLQTSQRAPSPFFSADTEHRDDPALSDLLREACPSCLLPVEVPLLLAGGTDDADVPVSMVEDFFWRAKEHAFNSPPALPRWLQQQRDEGCDVTTGLSPVEKMNILCNLDSTKQLSVKPDDRTASAFVSESALVPMKLLKMQGADHYSAVQASHPAFLQLYDELFIIAPSLSDIPELDILSFRPDEVRLAMEYETNSNSNSKNSNDLTNYLASERGHACGGNKNLEHIFEDDGASSAAASSYNGNARVDSNCSPSPGRLSRHSKSSSLSAVSHSQSASVDTRISDCMQLVDTVEMKVDELMALSSSEGSSGEGYYLSAATTLQRSPSKKRGSIEDSRDSVEHERSCGASERRSQQLPTTTQRLGRVVNVTSVPVTDHVNSVSEDGGSAPKADDTSSQSSADLQFFSFPAPVDKSKRRSFILPKFM